MQSLQSRGTRICSTDTPGSPSTDGGDRWQQPGVARQDLREVVPDDPQPEVDLGGRRTAA
jgi:hypothetical protein